MASGPSSNVRATSRRTPGPRLTRTECGRAAEAAPCRRRDLRRDAAEMPLRSAGTGAAGGASLLGSTTYLVPRPAAALAGHDTRNLNPERPSMTRAKDET